MGYEGKGGVQADSQVPVQGRACVMRVPFSRLGMSVKGQVWEKDAGFGHAPFEYGPVTHLDRDVKKAVQCGS